MGSKSGSVIKSYYSLIKPRVLYGNVITAVAGFLLASKWHIDLRVFVATIFGTSLVIGSACVINNYLDQDIDSKMERTKERALVAGDVKGSGAVIFSIILGLGGIATLYFFTSLLVVLIGILGFVVYVLLYGMLSKRLSVHGTLVGSISGATPVLAGYCAASGKIDSGAVIVFLILFFWQMPEFYSISIYRRSEYKAAGIPVMAVSKGVKYTKLQIFLYTIACVAATLSLTIFGYTGYIYLLFMGLISAYWLALGYKGFGAADSNTWARQMFHFSLVFLLAVSLFMSIGNVLP